MRNGKYKDFTGQRYGVVTVLERDGDATCTDHAYWLIRLECCGTIKSVSTKRIYDHISKPVERCIDCYRAGLTPEQKRDGVMIPGRGIGAGWWPVIVGPMGHRHGSNFGPMDRRESSAY